jgi:hypothetical protein
MLEHQPLIRRFVYDPCHRRDQHAMLAIVGQEGSGKSSVAVRIGELVDPDFSVDNVFWHPAGLLERLDEGVNRGECLVFDEAGVELGNRSWYESDQIDFNKVLQTVRNQNAAIIFTLPVFQQLDIQAQTRVKGLINLDDRPDEARGLASGRYYRIDVDRTDMGRDDIYRKKPEIRINGHRKTITKVSFRKPSAGLWQRYEAGKSAFQAEFYAEKREQFSDGVAGENEITPQAVADEIINDRDLSEFVNQHGHTKEPYIDKDLIELEYPDLSVRDAKKAKKLVERSDEVDPHAHV